MKALPIFKVKPKNGRGKTAAAPPARVKLPLIVWLVLIGNIMAFTEGSVMGFRLTGYGWFLPLCLAVFIVLINLVRVKFPFYLWLPWIGVVLGYYFSSEFHASQRSAQLLCPLVIGAAVSTYRYKEEHIDGLFRLLKILSVLLVIIILLRYRVPFTGLLPSVTGLSGHSMTAALLGTVFATTYAFQFKNDLRWWWLSASVPVFAVTRTAIAVVGLTLPLTWGPMKLNKRIALMVIVALVGLILFHTPRMQKKSFRSGEGELSDILSKDFRDNARFYMWKLFDKQIKKKPWFGYGAGAGEKFVRKITDGQSGYPHNDWRLTLYDYGLFGTGIYVFCIAIVLFHAYLRSRQATGKSKILFLAGASSFIPFFLLMYSDNIMVYVSFFGNLQFTILGIAYASDSNPLAYRSAAVRKTAAETVRHLNSRKVKYGIEKIG